MKTIAINGSSGFLGKQLIAYLQSNYKIIIIQRREYSDIEVLTSKIELADIVINIAGSSIAKYWTKKQKLQIMSSRIQTTKNLSLAIENSRKRPEFFISFSAIGIYDSIHLHDESSRNFDSNFLSKVCIEWEREALIINQCDVAICRLGIVLSEKGGFLKKLIFPFKIGLGAFLGNGKQTMSFISLPDFLSGIDFIIEKHISGIINLTSPEFCNNYEFSKKLSKKLHKPLFFRVPRLLIRMIFGEQRVLFLDGQKVIPKRLKDQGFNFRHRNIDMALNHLIKN